MITKNKIVSLLSIVSLLAITVVIVADLMYKFGNYDTAFVLAVGCYCLFSFLKKAGHVPAFIIVLVLLTILSLFYIQYGPVRITERTAEWLYIFFIVGLVQYTMIPTKINN